MMIGKLLGDGGINQQEGRKPRFQFTHIHSDFEWSNYCYHHLSTYLPLNPPKYKKTIDSRLAKGYSLSFYVQSKTSSITSYLRSVWYPTGKKILPYELITNYFNEISLAWWYMDDGHLKTEKNIPKKIILSTESFTEIENKWLIHFLHSKYSLKFRLDRQNRIVLYDQFQIHYFLSLVFPYFHHCIYRKIPLFCNVVCHVVSRRTTIYLPAPITLSSPTNDINAVLNYIPDMIIQFKQGMFYKKYFNILFNTEPKPLKSYQVIINSDAFSALQLLKNLTGLTFSRLTEICFVYKT